jgi:hypothetical protein
VHVRIEAADDRERGEDTLRAQRVRENLLSRSPLLRGSVVQGGAELKVSVVDHLEASWAV